MAVAPINATERRLIEALVQVYLDQQKVVTLFQKSIVDAFNETPQLRSLIHSIKSRLKDPDHLRDKLRRKIINCKKKGTAFDIDRENLFTRINDLCGVIILHLYTKQFADIDKILKSVFQDMGISLIEGPFARTWDDESRAFFLKIGVEAQSSPTMYTSVHYVVASNSRTCVTCEIQVRTLMEEVWGEVDHAINYPHKVNDVACSEQILALARSTSSATRLVDAIFATVAALKTKVPSRPKRSTIRTNAAPRLNAKATKTKRRSLKKKMVDEGGC